MTTDAQAPASLSLAARIALAAADRTAGRVTARAPREHSSFPHVRREALATRKAFRESVAILQAELIR